MVFVRGLAGEPLSSAVVAVMVSVGASVASGTGAEGVIHMLFLLYEKINC